MLEITNRNIGRSIMSGTNSFSQGSGISGTANYTTSGGILFNAITYVVKKIIGTTPSALPVQIIAVHGGGPNAPCTVDVQPVTNQIDGQGKQTPHGVIYGIPVHRQQSGVVSIVMDPVVGDKGMFTVCDRDISTFLTTGAIGGPGSRRRNSYSDGVYIGGMTGVGSNAPTATTTIVVSASGITITTPNNISFVCPTLAVTGAITATGEITAGQGTGDSVTLQNHTHAGVQTGVSNTQAPNPGT